MNNMELKGIDVSNYQKDLNLAQSGADFCIIKASEGVGWQDPAMVKLCGTLASDQIYGFYHFARPDGGAENTPQAEAQSFLNYVGTHVGKSLLALDWEPAGCAGLVDWAHQWLNYVYSKTGVKPLIYMNQSTENRYDWSPVANDGYGLWLANYGVNDGAVHDISVKHWSIVAMHQYTSAGGLDKNIFFGGPDAWQKYCTSNVQHTPPSIAPTPTPAPQTTKYKVGTPVCTNTIATSSTGSTVYKGDWQGIITRVIPKAPYPYLLNTDTGWTNDVGIDSDPHVPDSPHPQPDNIKPGDWVGVKTGALTYDGKSFGGVMGKVYYTADEIKGDRVVLDIPGICTAFHASDLFK